MEGNLKSKLALLLLLAAWWGAAAAQPVQCDHKDDGIVHCGDGFYCDKNYRCHECIDCALFKRKPPQDTNHCITSVVDCGGCNDGLTEDVQGLQCVSAEVSPAYVWVAIALGGLLLFVAAVAIVVYVLRNTDTFRVFHSSTSLQPGCGPGPPASAPEPPPPYNTLYSPVRPESPPAPLPLPPHFTDEEAASPFIKRPPPTPAREAAGNQEANVYNNPNYVRGPHLPSNGHTAAERELDPECLHDENTAESPWRPGDGANNNSHGDNADSGSSSSASAGGGSGSRSGSGSGSGSGAAPLSAALAAARAATLVRPPCQDAATPNKLPRLRQDTNNNRNNRERDDAEPISRSPAAPPAPAPPAAPAAFNIVVNVQQVNDVKL